MIFKKNKFKGFFFGLKKKTEAEKAEEMMQLFLKYVPILKEIARNENRLSRDDNEFAGQMYDYYQDYYDRGMPALTLTPLRRFNDDEQNVMPTENIPERKTATPLSVLGELQTVPTPFTCEDLEEKIATLQDKTKLVNLNYAKDQIEGLVKRLENRKKYKDFEEFYCQFPNTTDEKIDELIANYKLEINKSELFVPTFPKEAIEIMKLYTAKTKELSDENPVFYVIAEEKDFAKKRGKLDPILLVQSPFGFYWQILGAWDKEMLLLSEL